MSLHARLLEQADSLAKQDKNKPRQASLRRAVSAAYYSLFHLLLTEYAGLFTGDPKVAAGIARTVNHGDIAAVAREFGKANPVLPAAISGKGVAVPARLVAACRAFVDLQEERHDADYDTALRYTRGEVLAILATTRTATEDWQAVRTEPAARLFLACFQLKKSWNVER